MKLSKSTILTFLKVYLYFREPEVEPQQEQEGAFEVEQGVNLEQNSLENEEHR